MKNKSHGPAVARRRIPLTDCPSCAGEGLIRGVFHQLDCIGCHASGLVQAQTLEPLPLEELVIQLGMELRRSRAQLVGIRPTHCIVDEYQQPNRRGPGGSSFKGD